MGKNNRSKNWNNPPRPVSEGVLECGEYKSPWILYNIYDGDYQFIMESQSFVASGVAFFIKCLLPCLEEDEGEIFLIR